MWKKEYVFLICSDRVIMETPEDKELKARIFSYINSSIKSLFFKRKIEYVDYYTSKNSGEVYTIMSTAGPERKKNRFLALFYEIFAFTLSKESKIFDCYKPETIEFSNEIHNVKIYKFKI